MTHPPNEWTVLSMLEWGTRFFEEKKVRNPRLSIEWLLSFVLNKKRLDLYVLFERPLTKQELSVLRPLVQRRAKQEPLQYITGSAEFYHTEIKVKPGVLIPRMETEQLVDILLTNHPDGTLSVLDIGTGSGCIPIALKKQRPEWQIYATDISEEALKIAESNASLNDADIHFIRDNLFDSQLPDSNSAFDVIVSNPPYILFEEKEHLDEEVKNFEPDQALFCDSIEKMYSAIESLAQVLLPESGSVYLELHERHAEEISGIFKSSNWNAEIKKDYDNKPRFLIGKKLK